MKKNSAKKSLTKKAANKSAKNLPLFGRMMAEVLDFPEDLALDLPRITLVGNIHLNIENHKGIISYTPNEVRLKVSEGYLVARGAAFALRSISQSDVFLEGEINSLQIVLDSRDLGEDMPWDELVRLLAEQDEADDLADRGEEV